MSLPIERKLFLSTDIASFYIYHPDELAYRLTSPLGWMSCGFACRKEFLAGHLAGWATGSDGTYGIRLTEHPLTDREKLYCAGSWVFRLIVRFGRVLLDNGDAIPNADFPPRPPAADDDGWISLPNGDYKVTVHAIEWYSEPGAVNDDGQATENSLQDYVVQFELVESIASIMVNSSAPPRIECSRDRKPQADDGWPPADEYVADQSPIPTDQVLVLEYPNWLIVPGFTGYVPMADSVFESIKRIKRLILAPPGARSGQFGVLVKCGHAQGSDQTWNVGFQALRLIQVVDVHRSAQSIVGHIEPFVRPVKAVAGDELKALKTMFVAFARKNESFRKNFKTADFLAEQIIAMTSSESVTHAVLHYLGPSQDQQLSSLVLSDADRVRTLVTLLTENGYGPSETGKLPG